MTCNFPLHPVASYADRPLVMPLLFAFSIHIYCTTAVPRRSFHSRTLPTHAWSRQRLGAGDGHRQFVSPRFFRFRLCGVRRTRRGRVYSGAQLLRRVELREWLVSQVLFQVSCAELAFGHSRLDCSYRAAAPFVAPSPMKLR